MNLHEYQSKHLLQHYGITTPIGEVVQSEEAAAACPAGTEIGSPQQTPRTQLTRELEKYNRPVMAIQTTALSLATVKKEPIPTQPSTPERPNILNKRPHQFRPQYRYEPSQGACSPLNLSMKESIADRFGFTLLSLFQTAALWLLTFCINLNILFTLVGYWYRITDRLIKCKY